MVFKQFDSFEWWFGVGGGGIGGGLGLGFRVGCWITVEFFLRGLVDWGSLGPLFVSGLDFCISGGKIVQQLGLCWCGVSLDLL